MKTVAINEYGSVDEFQEMDLPKPLPSRGEVRIKICACGFNPVDAKIRSGHFGQSSLPLVLGSECSGVIDSVGDRVHDFSVGDKVWAFTLGPVSNGTYAEMLCLPASFISQMPKSLDFTEAAAVPLTFLTAFRALIAPNRLQKDRTLLITGGSGGVGSSAICLAKAYGAGPVYTTAGSEESREYLINHLGIRPDHILNYKKLSAERVKERFYLALDCVGGAMKKFCFEVADFYSHVVSILPEDEGFDMPVWGRESLCWTKGVSLQQLNMAAGAFYGDEKTYRSYGLQLRELARLFDEKNMQLPKIQNLGNLSAKVVKEAHRRLELGHNQGKMVMTVS